MGKPSQENFYKRLNLLAGTNKSKVNEQNNGNGSLIDFQKSDEGTIYGIVKENHRYFIKKSNSSNNNLDAADFAYIGGLENKHLYEYHSLGEAEKQRNMYIKSLNEAFSLQPKEVVNEAKKEEKIDDPFNFLRSRINEGKTNQKKKHEERFKSSLKENVETTQKKGGLLPETADLAIKKALGLINEEDMVTADSEIKDKDKVSEKSGKEKPQAPINDANAKAEAEKAMGKEKSKYPKVPKGGDSLAVNQAGGVLKEEASPLVTDDSELNSNDSLANKDNAGKENPQAPINDSNAKAMADKAMAKSGGSDPIVNNAEESSESDPLDDKEEDGPKKDAIAVNEDDKKSDPFEDNPTDKGAMSTEDSDQKDGDRVDDEKGHEKPEAPYNMYNQPDKGQKEEKGTKLEPKASKKDIVAEEKDLSTADSKIKTGDSLVNKTSEPAKGHGKSEIVADSELKPDDSLANDTKTNLPNPVAEAAALVDKLMESDSLIYADSPEDADDSLANDAKTNLPNPVAEAVGDEIDNELDQAADALDSMEIEPEPAPEMGGEVPAEPAPEADPMADPMGGEMPTTDDPLAGADGGMDLGGAPEGGEMEVDAEMPVDGGEMEVDAEVSAEEGGEAADEETKNEIKSLAGEIGEKARGKQFEDSDVVEIVNQLVEPFDTEDLSHNDQLKIQNKIKGEEGAGEDLPPESPEAGAEEPPVEDIPVPEMGGEEEPVGESSDEGEGPQGRQWEKDELDKNMVRQMHNTQTDIETPIHKLNKQAITDPDPLAMEGEEMCAECGTFESYAKSRGYENLNECGGMELANLLSGYANAHDEGMNDGDFGKVIILLTPEVKDELLGYGHDDFVSKAEEMGGEVSDEEKLSPGSFDIEVPEAPEEEEEEVDDIPNVDDETADAEEKKSDVEDNGEELDEAENLDELSWRDIKNVGAGIAGVGQKAGQKVADKAAAAQQKVAGAMQKGVDYVADKAKGVKQTYHKSAANRIINDIQQDAAKLGDTIGKFNARAQKAGQQPIPVQSIMMQITNQIKKGGQGIDLQSRRFEGEDAEPVMEFAPTGQNLGVATPSGAMSESEQKVRNYVKNRLAELAGKKKPTISEAQKPASLKKLDKMVQEQWELYKKQIKKK